MTVDVDTSAGVPDDRVHQTSGRSAPTHADHVSKHDVDALAGVIERARTCGDRGELWTSREDVLLPGFGDARPDCGEAFDRFCTGCGSVSNMSRTCYQSKCPRCAPSWARRTGTRVVAKLLAMRAYRDSYHESHQRLHHLVISPDIDAASSPVDHEQALSLTKDLLAEAGLEGWLAYHPFRGHDGDDRGEWAERLFDDRGWDDISPELSWSPHIHAVVVGHQTPGGNVTKELEARTGWVLSRITKEDSSVSLYDEYDAARAVTYCLSHVGTFQQAERRVAATRWFGEHVQDVTADAVQEATVDYVVRAVAPMTLGLPYNDLACSEDHAVDQDGDVAAKAHDHVVDLDRAQGKRAWELRPTVSTSSSSRDDSLWDSPGGELSADDVEPDLEPDALETQRCAGRLLPISKAAPYLASAEWTARATHAEQTRDAHQEWVREEPWIPAVDDASDAQVDAVELIIADRGGQPPD